jgi:hypothetical protein
MQLLRDNLTLWTSDVESAEQVKPEEGSATDAPQPTGEEAA